MPVEELMALHGALTRVIGASKQALAGPSDEVARAACSRCSCEVGNIWCPNRWCT